MKTLIALVFVATSALAVAAQVTSIPRPPQMPPPGRDNPGPATMPKGTGVISGSVISVDGGRPMRRAQVRVTSSTSPASRTGMTDDHGFFEFTELPAGDFTLRASKPGYLESIYGQKRPGSGRPGTPLALKDGQRIEKITVVIPKGGVLTGTISDDMGEPMFGVPVRALRYASRSGERTLVSAGSGTTDDRGIYRIPTLGPGDYVVMATPRADTPMSDDMRQAMEELATSSAANVAFNGSVGGISLGPSPGADAPTSGYAPVFYPSTTLASSATTVALAAAEEKPGIDIQLQLVPLGTITGTVIGDPRAVTATTIQLSDANTGLPGLTAKTARPDQTGKFTFTGIAPGQYNISAKSGGSTTVMTDQGGGRVTMFMTRLDVVGGPAGRGGEPPAPPMWAKAEVAVDGRTKSDVALVLQPGMTVSGRIAFDGTGDVPTDFSSMRMILVGGSANGLMTGSATATVEADGHFKIADVTPGRYRFTATPVKGWRPRSVDADNRDALDFMLEVKPNEDISNAIVTYTNKPADVTGVLQDASGMATSAYTIVLFAADQRFWTPQSRRIVSTRPSTEGKFGFRDLPAGDYRLVALEDVEPDSWFDPNVLKAMINGSIPVTIVAGEKKTQDIKVK